MITRQLDINDFHDVMEMFEERFTTTIEFDLPEFAHLKADVGYEKFKRKFMETKRAKLLNRLGTNIIPEYYCEYETVGTSIIPAYSLVNDQLKEGDFGHKIPFVDLITVKRVLKNAEEKNSNPD